MKCICFTARRAHLSTQSLASASTLDFHVTRHSTAEESTWLRASTRRSCTPVKPLSSFSRTAFLYSLMCTGNYSATSNNMKLVNCLLMAGLLHLVQRRRDWAGLQSTQSKCNSSAINGQCTNHGIALWRSVAVLLCTCRSQSSIYIAHRRGSL